MPQVTRTIGGTPREHTQIGVHTQVGKNIGINSSGTLFALDKWKKQNAKLTTDSGLFALKTLKNTFNKVMLLTFDEGGAFVRAFMWDDSLKGAKNESLTLPLSENSIFSIVAKTQKPFHGPVHPSDVNEAFFATWNNGELPDHATLVPLVFEDRVLGVLMGVGNSSLYNKDALRIAEKVAQEFVGKIAEVKVPKAA